MSAIRVLATGDYIRLVILSAAKHLLSNAAPTSPIPRKAVNWKEGSSLARYDGFPQSTWAYLTSSQPCPTITEPTDRSVLLRGLPRLRT